MNTVFVSYRRSDSAAEAGRLYDALSASFGERSVFMDIDSLRPGQDFSDVIEKSVASADALIAVIGPTWLTAAGADGSPRLHDPSDLVRMEIGAALRHGRTVIPVLVGGTPMPSGGSLPTDLQPLARLHALTLSHEHWHRDLDSLLVALGRSPASAVTGVRAPRATSRRSRWVAAAAVLAILALMIGVLVVRSRSNGGPKASDQSQSVGRLAVLPFENLGDSSDNARFTDGTTAEIRGNWSPSQGFR